MPLSNEPRAVVTGGGSGLGRAFCLELAQRGARIVISDVNLEGAEETARLVKELNPAASTVATACDVTQVEAVEGLAKLADEHFGGADLVINNAGVAVSGQVGDVPLEDWRWLMNVNLWGVVHGCHVFVPRFKAAGAGHVINVASAAGLISSPGMAPYNVSKAAVVALTETLAGELAETNVGATVLCPTFFRTNITAHGRNHGPDEELALAGKLMDRSKIQAADVARLALDGAARGDLYVVPMPDGRLAWRFKRLAPQFFYRTVFPRMGSVFKKRMAPRAP